MKLRTGHVSNSSSSSFILALKKMPEDAHEMQDMMFGKGAGTMDIISYYDHYIRVCDAAESAFLDVTDGATRDLDQLVGILAGWYDNLRDIRSGYTVRSGYIGTDWEVFNEWAKYYDGVYSGSWKKSHEEREDIWRKEEELRFKSARVDAEAFMKRFEGHVFVEVEYEDKSNLGVVMEHGNVFQNIPHIRINKH